MKNNEGYMNIAIATALKAKSEGGVAIGAVLVDRTTGNVIATGGSMVAVTHDPTAHAEINCMRIASQLIESDCLFDYVLYSTLEPCHMCLSASAWARVPLIYFGAYRKNVDATLFDIKDNYSAEEEAARMNLREDIDMKVIGGIQEEECTQLLANHVELPHHVSMKSS